MALPCLIFMINLTINLISEIFNTNERQKERCVTMF